MSIAAAYNHPAPSSGVMGRKNVEMIEEIWDAPVGDVEKFSLQVESKVAKWRVLRAIEGEPPLVVVVVFV